MPITYRPGMVYFPVVMSEIASTTLSASQRCAGAKAIGIEFAENGTVLNRTGVLTITVSLDGGVTFRAYNMLIDNLVNTNVQTLTRINAKTRNSAGADILWFDPTTLGPISNFKATITITDGSTPTGTFTVKAVIVY